MNNHLERIRINLKTYLNAKIHQLSFFKSHRYRSLKTHLHAVATRQAKLDCRLSHRLVGDFDEATYIAIPL